MISRSKFSIISVIFLTIFCGCTNSNEMPSNELSFKPLSKMDWGDTDENIAFKDVKDQNKALVFSDYKKHSIINFPGSDTKITISIGEDADIREVIQYIGKMVNLDMSVDYKITGKFIMSFKDKPAGEVLDTICRIARIRYSFEDGVAKFVRNEPYFKVHKVDFLNLIRQGNSSYTVNTQGMGGSDNGTTGSSNNISVTYEDNFWTSLEDGIKSIVSHHASLFQDLAQELQKIEKARKKFSQIESYTYDAERSDESDSISFEFNPEEDIKIDKRSGIINIFTTADGHEDIERYISKVSKAINVQISIEAKIIEVQLNEKYSEGINWDIHSSSVSSGSNFAGYNSEGGFLVNAIFKLIKGWDLRTSMDMLKTFGKTTVVSSPRIAVLNNQTGIASYVRNYVYFDTKIDEQKSTTSTSNTQTNKNDGILNISVNSEVKTVPVGVVLELHPSVDFNTGDINLSIRPTVSRNVGSVRNPATQIALIKAEGSSGTPIPDSIKSSGDVPIVETRSMDSVVRMKSGSVIAIGGIHEKRLQEDGSGIPKFVNVPILGRMGKYSKTDFHNIETVILIKAKIEDDDDENFLKWNEY